MHLKNLLKADSYNAGGRWLNFSERSG